MYMNSSLIGFNFFNIPELIFQYRDWSHNLLVGISIIFFLTRLQVSDSIIITQLSTV